MNLRGKFFVHHPDCKIAIDVSSLVRWVGAPVGISRTEHALAQAASHCHGGTLCIWDQDCDRFRILNAKFARLLTGWHGKIDSFRFDVASSPPRHGIRQFVPSFRHPVIMALERIRISTSFSFIANIVDCLQRIILAPRHHGFPLEDEQGRRFTTVPYDLAVGQSLTLGPHDTVLLIGNDWYNKDPGAIRNLKTGSGFRLAVICYDLIPLLFPEFFSETDVQLLRKYWSQMMDIADLLIFNSRCAEADAHRIAAELGLRLKATAVVPLGFDLPSPHHVTSALPEVLASDRYALFVSTVEPRKGHALLLRVWRRLLARNIPQKRNFRLVFVGRPGWLVDDLMREISTASKDGSVVWLRNIQDQELDSLYRGASFCLHPSRYEGFGLPILEGFARGKAVIASTGGALPEIVGDLSPCLDPLDEPAWEQMLAAWIEMPESYARYERRISKEFAHVSWPEAASQILKLAAGAGAMTEAVAD